MAADSPCLVCGAETDCSACRTHGTNSQQYEARKASALLMLDRAVSAVAACMAPPDAIDSARLRAIDCGATQDEIEKVVNHR